MNSRDQSVSPRMQHVSLAKGSLDAVPIPKDQPNSPTNKALEHISSRSDSHHTSISFPVPPPAGYTVKCGCGSRPLEKHIFNAPFIELATDETLNINGATTIDAAIPTAELYTLCEIGENRVQIYESPPEDPHIKNVQIPMIWWVTRRLVISYLSGTPKTRRCCSFWLPLADVQFIRSGPEVTLRWSDCNQMTQRNSGNYSQHYDWLYSPKQPNNGLLLRFNSDIDAQRYIDTLRLPYEDSATVSHSRTINASPSSEVQVFDVGKRGVRNYRVAVLTSNQDSLITSKLFIQWPDLDLSIYVNTSPPEGHQMIVEFKNVSTPTYYSDVRGEPAVDHKKTGRFNKALKIKCGFAVTFPIAIGDGVPVLLPSTHAPFLPTITELTPVFRRCRPLSGPHGMDSPLPRRCRMLQNQAEALPLQEIRSCKYHALGTRDVVQSTRIASNIPSTGRDGLSLDKWNHNAQLEREFPRVRYRCDTFRIK